MTAERTEGVKSLCEGTVRIVVRPAWAEPLDLGTTLPTAEWRSP